MFVSPPSRKVPMSPAPLLFLLLPLLLVACTGAGSGRGLPDAGDFAVGTCRDAAPAVLALDEQVRRAGEGEVDRAAARESLRENQGRLQALLGGDGEVGVALQDVVTRVGFARAGLDADALDAQEVADVTQAVDRFVAACVPEGT